MRRGCWLSCGSALLGRRLRRTAAWLAALATARLGARRSRRLGRAALCAGGEQRRRRTAGVHRKRCSGARFVVGLGRGGRGGDGERQRWGGAAASVRNRRRDRATEREGKCGKGRASSPPHLAPVTNGRRRGTAGRQIDGVGTRERCSVVAAQSCRARSVDGGGAQERCSMA